jgi:hypothetical protein
LGNRTKEVPQMPKRANKPNLEAIEPLLLRPIEIARVLNCSVRHVYNLMDMKLIDRVELGTAVRGTSASVKKLAGQRVQEAAE